MVLASHVTFSTSSDVCGSMNVVHMQAVGFIRHKFLKILYILSSNFILQIFFKFIFEWFWYLMSHFQLQVMFEVQ